MPRYVLTGSPLKATADGSPLQDAIEERNLRKATSVLKNDDKVNLSRDQWNQIFELIEERTANADENSENLRQATEFPTESAARSEMTQMYNVLKESGQLKLFGAVDPRVPLAAGSTNVPPPLMEGIIDLPMTALTPQPNNSLLFAGVAVALLEFIASAAFQIPMNTLALSSLLLVALDRLFLNGATFETFLKFFHRECKKRFLGMKQVISWQHIYWVVRSKESCYPLGEPCRIDALELGKSVLVLHSSTQSCPSKSTIESRSRDPQLIATVSL